MVRYFHARETRLAVAATLGGYFAAVVVAVSLTRFGNGVACVWLAGAVLLAALNHAPRRAWAGLAIGCWIVGTIGTARWGIGMPAAPVMSGISVSEALIAALLMRRWGVERAGFDSLRNLGLFAVAAGIIAPVATAGPAAVTVAAFGGGDVLANVERWIVAHALGALVFTPIFALIANGEMGRALRTVRGAKAREALGLVALVLVTAIGVFSQSTLPLLFLPVLPLMVITFRQGPIGAAVGLVVIAVVGGGFTLGGVGPVTLVHGSAAMAVQFFQFYLIVMVATVLPVAADLTRRAKLFAALRDSEARFRLLTEHSSDIVMNIDVDGSIRYVSPSIARLGQYDPVAMVGHSSLALIAAEDRDEVRAVHRDALTSPGRTFTVEFRGIVDGRTDRWFETHTQAILDSDGMVSGMVSAIREISDRKQAETVLAEAAHTDALTGLANRRVFDRELERLASGGAGAIALFDLDHFKRVNDRFGHAAGDEVLKAFALAASAQVRESDTLARIGGEEFGLICPGVGVEIAQRVCERIRLAVAALDLRADGWRIAVTVSVGIARVDPERDAASILGDADLALYEAKAAGRNRLSLAA